MNRLRKIIVLVLIGAVVSLGVIGCKAKTEPPAGEQPAQEASAAEQPSQEAPAQEAPAAEKPAEEKPAAEHLSRNAK
jgi:hypothetical protein